MTEKDILKIYRWHIIVAFIAVVMILPGPVYCQDDGVVLLIQQSPVQGGTVTPEMGVHRFEPGEEVVLTAVPKPGYQFIYWIGDVSEPTANRTSVYLNVPKIIIAVFERSEFEFLVTEELQEGAPGGGLIRSSADYANSGSASGGGKRPHKPPGPPGPPEQPTDFPVPPEGEENDFPVPPPIPEPATILLLFFGSLGLVRKRRKLQATRL
jgi:hypothetical protein